MLTRSTSIEEVERINPVIINPLQKQTVFMLRYNLYTMNVDCGRNCYNCKRFGHITMYFRS